MTIRRINSADSEIIGTAINAEMSLTGFMTDVIQKLFAHFL